MMFIIDEIELTPTEATKLKEAARLSGLSWRSFVKAGVTAAANEVLADAYRALDRQEKTT